MASALRIKRLGFLEPVGVHKQHRQIVEAGRHVGMFKAIAFLMDGQRPAYQRLGLRKTIGRPEGGQPGY